MLEALRHLLESNVAWTEPLKLLAAIGSAIGTMAAACVWLAKRLSAKRARRAADAESPETVEEADLRIQNEPSNPRHHLSRAELLSDQGDYLAALAAIDRALALRTSHEAIEARSRINLSAGNLDDAIADAEHAIQLGASKIECALTVGHALQSKGDYLGAEKQAEKILELGDSSERPYWLRAIARIQQNKLQEALPDVLKVVRADEDAPEPRIVAANLYLDLGDAPNAVVQFEKAIELGEPDADVFRALGDAYLKADDRDQAKASYHQALALDPNHMGAKEALEAMTRSRAATVARATLGKLVQKLSWSA
jgi:tetratricopeptide (TPR) repeat protein